MEVRVVKTEQELADAFNIRKQVFVSEQQVPLELEIDEYEDASVHFILYDDDLACGAGRFREVDGVGKAERICILASHRKKGCGVLIMNALESYARDKAFPIMKLNAQTQAIPFYERIGYSIVSEEFLDAGIPHKTMKKELL